jgi:hypothetical protein
MRLPESSPACSLRAFGLVTAFLSILLLGKFATTGAQSPQRNSTILTPTTVYLPAVMRSRTSDLVFVSTTSGGTVQEVSFADEDILAFETHPKTWEKQFDGADVGLGGTDIQAFDFLSDGSLLLSLNEPVTLTLGVVNPTDIIRFTPTSLGSDTSGTFDWYFDGSDVGLDNLDSEEIDAIAVLADGRLALSTNGSFDVPGLTGKDEDLIVFSYQGPIGQETVGVFALYLDGSAVGLGDSSDEDVSGAWIDPENGAIYLTTRGPFAVDGAEGDGNDIFVCAPFALGGSSGCVFTLYWEGSANGLVDKTLDGISIKKPE